MSRPGRAGVSLALAASLLVGCRSGGPRPLTNIAWSLSADTTDYRTWDLDPEACVDLAVSWVDGAEVDGWLVSGIEEAFAARGLPRLPGQEVDFLVSYELWVDPDASPGSPETATRASLAIRDARSGRFVWRATRKVPLGPPPPGGSRRQAVRDFAGEMIRHTDHVLQRLAPSQDDRRGT